MRGIPCVNVSNVLSKDKREQVIALGRLGWSLRRIEAAVHIRRETIRLLHHGHVLKCGPRSWRTKAPAES